MTVAQEDALYDYLDNTAKPFTVSEAAAAVKKKESGGARRLAEEVEAFLRSRRLAFPVDGGAAWVSRRAFFDSGRFAIAPTRLEIRNGILIPGHRCVPLANPILLPHEFRFLFGGEAIPQTSSEGPPADFYPYYDLYGEEYAPQYLARETPENEESFNADAYEDPPEVSVKTLDMRALYRELAFVPGDRLVLRVADWKGGVFEIERKAAADDLAFQAGIAEWATAVEKGFLACFDALGPGASTEEQIAFAFWYGGPRTLAMPALSLEEFIYEKTDKIETVQYGMETRFWRAGKEIPDRGLWTEDAGPPDKTDTELLLARLGVPVSEYVIEAYIRDAFYRRDTDIYRILERVVPPSIEANQSERLFLAQFISEARDDIGETYNLFIDRAMGPLRSRAAELHTAVVDLAARVGTRNADAAWLPKHAFVTLAQLQTHAANLLEDLDFDDPPEEREMAGMENSLDGMIDTYDDLKLAIDESLDGYRRSRFQVVRPSDTDGSEAWRVAQISLAGTGVWRRVAVPETMSLAELHACIQVLFGWTGGRMHGFVADGRLYGPKADEGSMSEARTTVGALAAAGTLEFSYDYDYGSEWEVRVNLLHAADPEPSSAPRCLAGEGSAPPETVGGPLRFRRFVSALKGEAGGEKDLAKAELGADFDPDAFDPAVLNARLAEAWERTKEGDA